MTPAGSVLDIHTAPEASAPMESHERVEAVSGQGLRGDRYFASSGTYSESARGVARDITFIEAETIEAIQRDYDITLEDGEHRRNITTRGVALNHLVDKRFRVGDTVCAGVELCAPCSYLEQQTEREGIHDALVHRGGLRAHIVTSGPISIGNQINVEDDSSA